MIIHKGKIVHKFQLKEWPPSTASVNGRHVKGRRVQSFIDSGVGWYISDNQGLACVIKLNFKEDRYNLSIYM